MPTIDDILRAQRRSSIFDRVSSGSSSTSPAPEPPSIYERLSQNLSEPLPMEGRLSFLPAMVTPERGREWALPGVVAGAWNAFTAPGRALAGQELGPDEALNVAGTAMLGGMPVARAAGVGGPGELGLNVFHGSPHRFEKFDMSKIGTGEGAQAYGHGLYLAESPGVAGQYQRTLTENKIPDVEGIARGAGLNLSRDAQVEIHRFGGSTGGLDPLASARALQATNAELQRVPTKKLASIIEQYRSEKRGSLYKVDLPDEHIAKMLDWDKPLSQQPDVVKALAERLQGTAAGDALGAYNGKFSTNALTGSRQYGTKQGEATGADLYNALAAAVGSNRSAAAMGPDAASKLFRELGIPGIRYLDQGSRMLGDAGKIIANYGSREKALEVAQQRLKAASVVDRDYWQKIAKELEKPQSSNFVVFDDQIPKILSRE